MLGVDRWRAEDRAHRLRLENAFAGAQAARYELRPKICWPPTRPPASATWT
jgi:hypothetical protein